MLTNKIERLTKVSSDESGLVFAGEKRDIEVKICAKNIIRVKLVSEIPYGEAEKILINKDNWGVTDFKTADGDPYKIETENITLLIYKDSFKAEFFDKDGKLMLSSPGGGISFDENEQGLSQAEAIFKVDEAEHFYGLGDGGDGFDRKGTERRIWSGHTARIGSEIPSPFIMSTNGYGLFFHNPYEANIAISKESIVYRAFGGTLDCYFIYGPSFQEIIRNYYELLGYPAMLPKWAFGYQQSSRHFINSQEVMDLPKDLRERGIPCDHITFLSTYSRIHGREQGWDSPIARYEFNPYLFPKPQEMIDEIKSMNFNIMCHQYPQVGRDTEGYEEFEENGYGVKLPDGSLLVFNECDPEWDNSYVDFTNPKAREWWWNKVKKIFDMGVNSWWNDGGEGPEAGELFEGSYKKVHNVFDLFRDRLMYEKIREEYPEMRVLLRCRCGYAGIHRYGAIIQPGDMNSGLDVLKAQIIKTLNSSLSGNPFRGPDMGGHYSQIAGDGTVLGFHTYTGGESRTDEIYLRWIQFCAFSSIMWAHGHPERSKLPWMRGPKIEAVLKRYIELRYRLLPYIYTNVWLNCSAGEPLMRPLVVDYPDDETVHELGTEYLFGKNILVCPVLEEGVSTWKVYLPEGTWINFWTHEEYKGKQYADIAVDAETLPVFMKAGSITPMGPVVQYVNEKPLDNIELLVYPDKKSEFVLYEDDGETYKYEKGQYSLTKYSCSLLENGSTELNIAKAQGGFSGKVKMRSYLIRLYAPSAPKDVKVNGVSLQSLENGNDSWRHDSKKFVFIKLSNVSDESDTNILVSYTGGR